MTSTLKKPKHKIYIAVITSLMLSQTAFAEENIEQLSLQSKKAIKQLATELKSRLTSTMKAEGPEAALEVCNIEAPIITSAVSNSQNIEVKRTSLKPRNEKNAADEWEQKILASFEKQKSEGARIPTLEQGLITTLDGQKTFRFMKAIPTQEGCLACHGTNVKPELQETISKLYPNDKATGFNVGDIRGAFSVQIKL